MLANGRTTTSSHKSYRTCIYMCVLHKLHNNPQATGTVKFKNCCLSPFEKPSTHEHPTSYIEVTARIDAQVYTPVVASIDHNSEVMTYYIYGLIRVKIYACSVSNLHNYTSIADSFSKSTSLNIHSNSAIASVRNTSKTHNQ